MIEKYDYEYKGVKCIGVDFSTIPLKFIFEYDGKTITYNHNWVDSSQDIQLITKVIEDFLEEKNKTNLKEKMVTIITNNKQFIKKVIVFIIAYILMTIFNNNNVDYLLRLIFGDVITVAIHSIPLACILNMEV